MATALFLLLLARQSTLTMTVPAARVPVVLQQIAEKTGLALEAGAAMRQEVVTLYFKDVPAETVLAKLAEVTGGEWRESGGVRRLFPSTVLERRERQQREALLADGAKAKLKAEHIKIDRIRNLTESSIRPFVSLSEKAIAASRAGKEDAEAALTKEFEDKDVGSPIERLLVRLVDLIPFSSWTSLPSGGRIVYSSIPTPMQRGLPTQAAEEIQRFVAEREVWNRLMGPIYSKEISEMSRELEKGGEHPDLESMLPKALPNQFKVNLAIQVSVESSTATATLSVRDLNGNEVENLDLSLRAEPKEEPDTEAADAPVTNGGDIIPISQEAIELTKLIGARVVPPIDPSTEARITKWRPLMIDPRGNEPLATFGQLWIDLAKSKGVNLIAYADDFMMLFIPPKPVGAGLLLERVSEGNDVSLANGWMTIRPKVFADVRPYRIDRDQAANLFAAALKTNGLTIADASEYVSTNSSTLALSSWDAGILAFLLWTNGISRPRLFSSTPLKIWGLLSANERQALHARALQFSELPLKAQEMLARDLFWNESGDAIGDNVGEPTDQFPNGLPAAGTFKIAAEGTESVIIPMTRVGERELPAALGRNAAQFGKGLAGLGGSEAQRKAAVTYQGYRRFRLATGHWIEIETAYSPTVKSTERLYELISPPGPILAFEDLPSAFRSEIEAARQKAIKDIQNRGPATTSTPPP